MEEDVVKNFELNEGAYLIVTHDDESLRMKTFKTLEDVKKNIEEQYDEEDVIFTDELFRKHFDDSYVDGDSYEAKVLLKFENNTLMTVHGFVEKTMY